ncbi:hypothetical protein GCM10010211_26010 [Streptomyces albospinus]|uniref:Uncharacterized protein n=1 Tax=Streptomyces albospinus TaxID=285515 RepID=A0ABQ2V0U2_9ACTN|nr:hypothetical protein GCM10010211_26010 [Streptomyces albospinus]
MDEIGRARRIVGVAGDLERAHLAKDHTFPRQHESQREQGRVTVAIGEGVEERDVQIRPGRPGGQRRTPSSLLRRH